MTALRAVLNRRRIGRGVMVAAVVAAITCLVGGVVAWRLLGDLRDRSEETLELVRGTLVNIDETLAIAQDVTETVAGSIDTLQQSLATLSTSVGAASAVLGAVADATQDVPPALDGIDDALTSVRDSASVVDTALQALDQLPFGPNFDSGAGLASAVEGVRTDLQPIADGLRSSTTAIRELSGSSEDLVTQVAALDTDLSEVAEALARSDQLLSSYRADTSRAVDLATESLDELDRDVWLARILTTVLAVTIAIGQIAPFHIGRQLARSATSPTA
jgi:DNA repair ATPase RecN